MLSLLRDRRSNISLRQRWRQMRLSLKLSKIIDDLDKERKREGEKPLMVKTDEEIEEEIRNASPGAIIHVPEGWLERTKTFSILEKTGSRPAKPLGSVPNAREHWSARPLFLLALLVAIIAFWAGIVLLIGWWLE